MTCLQNLVNKQFTLWATAMVLATTILIGIGLAPIVEQRVYSVHERHWIKCEEPLSHIVLPIATSGNNIYVTWSDNKTGNNEP